MIYVVKDGTIVESGKHEDLLQSGGLYSELHQIQFQQQNDEVVSESH